MGVAGAEKHLLFLLPELKKMGVACEVICVTARKTLNIEKVFLQNFEEAGIKTTIFSWRTKFEFWGIAKKISRYLKANDYHILHAHLFYGDFIAAIIKTCFLRSLIVLSTKHGYKEAYQLKLAFGKKPKSRDAYFFLSRWISKQIDHHLAVSKTISDLFFELKLVPGRMEYVHHGIKLADANMHANIVEGAPKILTVGRLEKIKGHIFLLRALPKIAEYYPHVKLIVLGDGSMKEELINEAARLGVSGHIAFSGYASPQSYAAQCSLVAIPSLFEAFGLVYVEAFAMRLPLVAFETGAAKEIIKDEETGLLVRVMEVDMLAEKLIYLLRNPGVQKKLAETAFSMFKEHFTAEGMAEKTLTWYRSVLKI